MFFTSTDLPTAKPPKDFKNSAESGLNQLSIDRVENFIILFPVVVLGFKES